MKEREISRERNTKETQISLTLSFGSDAEPRISSPVPFFNHILTSMAFHGGFHLTLEADGDVDVDPHHLVEDTGLVLGDALREYIDTCGPVMRFGHAVIPMDEALSEATVDASGRPFLVLSAEYPQAYAGEFPVCLIKEFLIALTTRGGLTLHAECRRGENSHHMVEALFKALGRALATAFAPREGAVASTKGTLYS